MARSVPSGLPRLRERAAGMAGLLLLSLWLATSAWAQSRPRLDVPYVPTPVAVVERMLALAQVQSGDYLIDLGSGDGRIAVAAASAHGARATGVDIDPVRVQEARENARRAGVQNRVEFRQQDIFQTDFSDATVLTMYLLPDINLRLRPRVLDELAPGTRVVSHAFTMGDWEPDQQAQVGAANVFLWIVPAKVAGDWRVSSGDGDFTVSLQQTFQKIDGSVAGNGQAQLADARLSGRRIEFTVQDGQRTRMYRGLVDGNTIRAAPGDGAVAEWSATRL